MAINTREAKTYYKIVYIRTQLGFFFIVIPFNLYKVLFVESHVKCYNILNSTNEKRSVFHDLYLKGVELLWVKKDMKKILIA